jgi:hypothetical protein
VNDLTQEKKSQMRRRLKKVAALMASDNEHEAEAARRQAEAIMREYQLDQVDQLIPDVEMAVAKAGAERDPAEWERRLANLCGMAQGCEVVFTGRWGKRGEWKFIGIAPGATLAGYAFEALGTKHRSDRRKYVGTALKRFRNEKNKRAAADTYSRGWVAAIRGKFPKQTLTALQDEAVQRFMAEEFGELGTMKPRKSAGNAADKHGFAGIEDGRRAELHAGVGVGGGQKRIGRGA